MLILFLKKEKKRKHIKYKLFVENVLHKVSFKETIK